jgi:hypothetical protein
VATMVAVKPPPSLVVSIFRCSHVRGVRMVLLVWLRLAGVLSLAGWPSTATAVSGRARKGGEERTGVSGPARQARPGRGRQAEREKSAGARGPRTRVQLGQAREGERGSRPVLPIFIFFQKCEIVIVFVYFL